ncbi:uncharacterized protein [Amphiura filiformis]|uniref:uncharacterized protein isoform X2 n=1 Tax=Amphiura filiformis TaxID=82378 RepID=UPI003B2121C2
MSNVQNGLKGEELKSAIEEFCSDVLPSVSVSVSSSLSGMKVTKSSKHSRGETKKSTMQVEVDDVASTSDNRENDTTKSKPPVERTDRRARQQSPGVASSSDDQDARVGQRRIDSVDESENKKRQRTVPSDDEAETSSSVATSKPQRAKVGERTVPSDDEAETSTSDSVSRNRETRTNQKTTSAEAEVNMTSSSTAAVSASKIVSRNADEEAELSTSNSVSSKRETRTRQKTTTSEAEVKTTSSSTAAVSASKVISRKADKELGEAVESSGLDSDASGPVSVRSRAEGVGGGKTLEIGSSDEAAVSGYTRRTAKVTPNRRGSDEASTSADVQPTNPKVTTKDREALARVTRQQESTARGRRIPKVADGLSQSDGDGRETEGRRADTAEGLSQSDRDGLERGRGRADTADRLAQSAGDGPERGRGRADMADSRNDGDVKETAIVSVECPLCGIKFPIQQIEGHASECNGPQEEVAVVPRHTRQQEQIPRTSNQRDDEEDGGGDGQLEMSEEFPNWNAEMVGRNQTSRKKPVHTYSRHANANATKSAPDQDDMMDDWMQAGDTAPRPGRSQLRTKVTKPIELIDEDDESNDITPEMDHVDATIYQMVENNELQLVQPGRSRTARRRSPSPEEDEEETEPIEKCFLCNKLIPRSMYEAHVNEEIDRTNNQNDDSSEGAAGPAASREGIRAGTGLVRRTRRTEEPPKPKDNHQNAAESSGPEIIDDESDDYDEDDDVDDDDEKPFDPANVSFGDSPIRAFKKISEQPNNLIDFKNQFKTSSKPVKSLYKETGKGRGKRKAYRGKRGRGKRRR